jgi:hypothetical protein
VAQKIPDYVVTMMADRGWRMAHYVWHEVRNMWLLYDEPTRQALRSLGWEPPRPARELGPNNRPRPILNNDSGEDFLYMHREMIRAVNERLAGDINYPRVVGWSSLPAPGDTDYPVPPAWDTGDADFNDYLNTVKTDQAFDSQFNPWQTQYTDSNFLKSVSLGELGARIEFTIHNQMHMRFCAEPSTGIRPDAKPTDPAGIDAEWDKPEYDWLGDTYSSHVNSTFWKLHGWVDDRITAWAAANGVTDIQWKGTWLGKMPSQPVAFSFLTVMAERAGAIKSAESSHSHHHGHVEELQRIVRLIAGTGKFCHFYDRMDLLG